MMTFFNYRALDATGMPVEGALEAESARAVIERLQADGLKVTSVTSPEGELPPISRKTHLTWQDLTIFNEQLAAITRAGLPIAPSLAAISDEIDNPRIKAVFKDIHENLESGRTLSEAFERHAGALSPAYCAMIHTGETTGTLTAILESLTSYSRRMVELQYAIQQTLIYPLILLGAALAVFLLLCIKVVPVFADIFAEFGARLPGPTQFLVDFAWPLAHNPVETIAVCALVYVVMLVFGYRILSGRSRNYIGDWFRSKLFLFNKLFVNVSLARFCHTLGLLVECHTPMIDALRLAGAASGNAVLVSKVARASKKVEMGIPLSAALRETGWFRSSFCWFLENAEQRGDVGCTLRRLADDYERSVDTLRRWVSMVAGPILIVSIALVFGFIIISLYLPIFSLGDAISAA